jgi:hypothetical protein
MDDETKQLLREIRDIQREHLELLRGNVKEAEEVNRIALENHTKYKAQTKQTSKLMVVIVVIVAVCMIALEIMKRFR